MAAWIVESVFPINRSPLVDRVGDPPGQPKIARIPVREGLRDARADASCINV